MAAAKTDTWFPMYPADYLKDTLDLTLEEDAFYSRALNQVYINKGRIPKDPERLQRLLRVNRVQYNRCRWILGRYFYEAADGYGSRRADEEIRKANERAEVARNNGRNGGRPPKPNPKETQRVISGLPDGFAAGNPYHNPEKSSSSSSSQSSPIGEDPSIVPQPKKAGGKKPKTLIPDDWQPTPETLAWCAKHRLPEPEYQVLLFVTHWQDKAEARADWQMSFRKWMTSPYRKDRPNAANRQHPGGFESAQQRRDKRLLEIAGRTGAGSAHADHPSLRVGPEGDSLGRGVGYRGPDGNG